MRDLKQQLTQSPDSGGMRPQQTLSVPTERTSEIRIRPDIALGAAPGRRPNDYRLAVRIQDQAWISSRRVQAIIRAARNEVDVEYIGVPTKLTAPGPSISPGASVGHYKITAGTLGAFVRTVNDGKPRILSNNHVLADENRAAVGDEILHPGAFDGGRSVVDRIGSLDKFIRLRKPQSNLLDGALAVVDDGIDFDAEVPGIGPISDITLDRVTNVAKVGRTTGLTRGRVTAVEVDGVAVRFSAGILRFDGQIEISSSGTRPFSAGGDSGSLIVEPRRRGAVGLLFAGSEQGGANNLGVTYATPIDVVFDQLGVTGLW